MIAATFSNYRVLPTLCCAVVQHIYPGAEKLNVLIKKHQNDV